MNTRTKGENQSPIHYAAKYNAVDSLKVLLHMGANIGDRDYRDRTPLFVAAETGNRNVYKVCTKPYDGIFN